VVIHFLIITMYNIEILYPKKKNLNDENLENFIKRDNELLSVKIEKLIETLDAISQYWISKNFQHNQEFKENSLGFIIPWLKKSNSKKILNLSFQNYKMLDEPIKNNENGSYLFARPNGIALHWMTGNVPVITLISLFQSILTKNKNIVKVSSHYKDLFEAIFNDLTKASIQNKLKNSLKKILNSILIIYVDHKDRSSLEWISKKVDTRLIWGGKEAVSNIISLPKKITCKDIIFGPKVSLSYISKKKLTNKKDLKNFTELFANDVFNFDQLGCNSPHNLFIEKGTFFSKKTIAYELSKIFTKKLKDIKNNCDPVSKYNFLNKKFNYDITDDYESISDIGFNWNIFINKNKIAKTEPPLYNRSIFISGVNSYDDLRNILPENIQSLGLYVQQNEKKKIMHCLSDSGVERFPNIGSMSIYSHPWDGYFPMQSLIRWVSDT